MTNSSRLALKPIIKPKPRLAGASCWLEFVYKNKIEPCLLMNEASGSMYSSALVPDRAGDQTLVGQLEAKQLGAGLS